MLKIVISPAKKMNITDEFPCNATVPVFSDRADVLHGILKNKNIQELKTLWKCSDKLAEQSYQRLHAFSPDQAVTPALLAYEGIQYQHIAPSVFTDAQWHYVNVHLRILSGFYGILKPTDKVIPYRLEMQAKLETAKKNDLYEYWSDTLYQSLLAEGMTELVNLASAEYSKAILPYKNIRCIKNVNIKIDIFSCFYRFAILHNTQPVLLYIFTFRQRSSKAATAASLSRSLYPLLCKLLYLFLE